VASAILAAIERSGEIMATTIVPQNMPGAGGLNAANHIYNVA
jgi:hypothetical protein